MNAFARAVVIIQVPQQSDVLPSSHEHILDGAVSSDSNKERNLTIPSNCAPSGTILSARMIRVQCSFVFVHVPICCSTISNLTSQAFSLVFTKCSGRFSSFPFFFFCCCVEFVGFVCMYLMGKWLNNLLDSVVGFECTPSSLALFPHVKHTFLVNSCFFFLSFFFRGAENLFTIAFCCCWTFGNDETNWT